MHDAGAQLGQDIARFAHDPNADELGAALLVGRALADEFDSPRCRLLLEQLAEQCPAGSEPWTFLADLGFGGAGDNTDAIDNSRLDWVLDHRQGIPISLGVLLIYIAKRTGHGAVGINFPGHFLVRVGTQLVDPLVMAAVSEDQCLDQLGQGGQPPPGQDVFQEAPPKAILLRMLNNVKYQYVSAAQWDRALDMVDWQLQAQPDSGQLFMERGELWNRLGGATAAREAYEKVLQYSKDPALRAAAQSRLASLPTDETIH